MSKFAIDNGFPNHHGEGPNLSGKLIEGTLAVGDKLVISEQVKIPIIAIKHLPFENTPSHYLLTIPRDFENDEAFGFKLFELYGKVFDLLR